MAKRNAAGHHGATTLISDSGMMPINTYAYTFDNIVNPKAPPPNLTYTAVSTPAKLVASAAVANPVMPISILYKTSTTYSGTVVTAVLSAQARA